jgi:PAS domain S-box-containing protein
MDLNGNGTISCRSEPSFAETIDFIPDPCFAIDLQGKVIAWNQAIADLTGITREKILGHGDYAYAVPFHGTRRPILIDLVLSWDNEAAGTYTRLENSGDSLVAESENHTFKPSLSYFWNKASRIYGSDGVCIGAIEVIRDITELKRSELELKRAEAEKTIILNTTSELVIYLDLDMRIKWINRAAAEVLDRKEVDLIGRYCYEVWHQRQEPCTDCPVVKAKLTCRPQQSEIATSDGRTWLARSYPVTDQSGKVISLIEFTLEITDRKQTEEKLRQTAASLLEAQRIASIGNWHWDIESGRSEWSDEMFRIMGIEKQEPGYELARSLVHPEDRLSWEESLSSALSGGRPQADYRVVRPDGKTVWIHNEALLLRDENGRAARLIGTAQDVTAQKTIEFQLLSQQIKLRRFTKLQQMIARISTRFANSGAARLNLSIEETLGDIGRFIDVDRSYLFQYSQDLSTVSNTYEWCAQGIRPERLNMQNLPTASLRWSTDSLRRGENIVADSIVGLPEEALAEKELLASQGIRSVLLVPIQCQDCLIGFLGFDAVQRTKHWTAEDILLLRTVSEIVGNTILRVRSEQELRNSEERFRLFMDQSQVAAWMKDEDGRYVYLNRLFQQRFCGQKEWFGKTGPEMWPLKTAAHFEKEDRAVLRSGRPLMTSGSAANVNGTYSYWHYSKFLFQNSAGQRFVAGIGVDITERKKTEDALRISEERHRLALETVQLGTWSFNPGTEKYFFDERSRAMLGMQKSKPVGQPDFLALVHPEDSEKVADAFARVQNPSKGGEEMRVEFRIVRKDGQARWIHANGKAYFRSIGAERKAIHVIGTFMDVTRHKRDEQILLRLNETLEHQVAERTAELARRNKEIKELARKTISAMENDRKAVSKELHDSIGGTLAAIKHQLECRVAEMDTPPPHVTIPLETVVGYLLAAIAESRRITKRLRPHVLDDFGLSAAIRDCLKDFETFYPKTRILFKGGIDEAEFPIDVKIVIYRVLQEALNNVGKHSSADEVYIQCRRYKNWVKLKVKDNGAGFDVRQFYESRELLLEGYGLQSMKERIEICNGKFHIDSAPGKGTTINAAVPLIPS